MNNLPLKTLKKILIKKTNSERRPFFESKFDSDLFRWGRNDRCFTIEFTEMNPNRNANFQVVKIFVRRELGFFIRKSFDDVKNLKFRREYFLSSIFKGDGQIIF